MDLIEVPEHGAWTRHPWERSRWEFFRRELARAGLLRDGLSAVDVGAGDGWFAEQLALAGAAEVVCWDPGYEDAGPRSASPRVRYTPGRPGDRFDLALLLHVTEHVEDDREFVRSIVEDLLHDRGYLLFNAPAWPALYSAHDARLRHLRRYTPAAARGLLEGAGLRVLRSGGLYHSLLLARAAQLGVQRFTRRAGAHLGEWRHSGAVTAAVLGAMRLDTRLSGAFSAAGWDVPGLNWWALCQRA